MRALLLALGLMATALPSFGADEAVLPDGRRLSGELQWQQDRPRFVAKDRSLYLKDVHQVRCTAKEAAHLAGVVHRVVLRDGQQLTGELLHLDGDSLRLQPAWSKVPLDVPRSLVREVSHLPGFLPLVDELRPPTPDITQDEAWLMSGDQLFGRVVRTDRKAIEMEGRFGQRTLPWSEVRGIHLRHAAGPLRTSEGEHVRLQLHSGVGAASDEIEGMLRRLDRDTLVLQFAGSELTIPRDRLRQVQGTFYGRRVELDNQLHHLGRDVRAAFPVPRPEGLSFPCKFTLKEVPKVASLVIEAAYLKGPGDGQATAKALERGGLRTEVLVNGRTVDYLNHHGERASAEPRRLRLPLPSELLRGGENVLELRQSLDRPTGQYEDCMIFGIVLEMPR